MRGVASFIAKIKKWMSKQESSGLRYEKRHQAFDDETDRTYGEQKHMNDRISEAQDPD